VAQADSLTPQDILQETINRVLSIAAVHEILAHDHHNQIGLLPLVRQVAQFISASMTLRGQLSITVEGDDLKLPTQYATNLALITNELIQNALEHSLTYEQDGQIVIQLQLDADCLELTVTDNGRGLPPNFTMEMSRGLGLDLVYTMVTEDLEGEFSLEPSPTGGTQAIVRVPTSKMKEQTINDLH
jgi:two-component sensor histidine kinase